MKGIKTKASLLVSSMSFMMFLTPAAVIASMIQAFPDTNISVIQMIISIPSLISIPAGFLNAALARKYKKKYLITAGTLLYLIGGFMPFFIHSSAYVILGGSCLIGVGMGMALTSMTALICEFYEGQERGQMLGMFAAFLSIGGTVSALLGGFLGRNVWYHAFLTYLLLVPIILVEIMFLPEGHLDVREKDDINQNRHMSKEVWIIAITGFVFYAFINTFNNNASMLVEERHLGGSVQASYITTCYTIAGLITGMFMGRIVGAVKRKSIALAYLLGAFGLCLSFFANNIALICAGAFISGVGFCIYASTANFHVSELSNPGALTFSLAFLAAIINLGQAFSPVVVNVLSSVINDLTGTKFIFGGIVVAAIGIIAMATLENPREEVRSLEKAG